MIHVHLLVCYLNKLQNARCNDKDSSRSLGSVSNGIHVNRNENHGQGSERGCSVNPLNAELNPTCHLLALLGAHHIFHFSGLRVNVARFRQGLFHVSSSLFRHVTKRALVVT